MIAGGGEVLGFSFFGPLVLTVGGAVLSGLLGVPEQVVGGIVEEVVSGLAGAVVGALVDLAAWILGFFWDAAEPELTSSWFYGAEAPYSQMVVLATPLLLAFFLAGVIQGVVRGDTAGMLRMALLRLPGAVLAMSVVIVLADVLLDVADEMSDALLAGFRDDVERIGTVLSLVGTQGGVAGLLLILVFAGLGLLAAVVVLAEMFIRSALLYLVAAFSPLVYAAAVWEPLRGSARKLGEIALALIVSKVAIALALAVSAAAMVSAWPSSEPTAITTPEQAAWQADQSTAQTIGVLISAVVMFVVAAFMPFVLWRLLPLAEGALVGQGVRGAPMRSAHLAASAATMAAHSPATAALRAGSSAGAGSGSGRRGGSLALRDGAGGSPQGSRGRKKGRPDGPPDAETQGPARGGRGGRNRPAPDSRGSRQGGFVDGRRSRRSQSPPPPPPPAPRGRRSYRPPGDETPPSTPRPSQPPPGSRRRPGGPEARGW